MNREPDFEVSADMRLLELQRSALGLSAPERPAWETRLSTEPSFGLDEPRDEHRSTPVLAVELSANPDSEIITGTVITFSLSVANEGSAVAQAIRISVPRPAATTYRNGSFVRDGRASHDGEADAFFGAGLFVDRLPAGSRTTFVWKLGVGLGTKPLVVFAHVAAEDGAVIGARPLSISRKRESASVFGTELSRAEQAYYEPKALIPVEIPADELPIYELDEEEQVVYEAADAALSPVVEPAADIEPEQPSPAVPVPEPAAVARTTREGVLLYTAFEPTTLAYFERVFNGSKAPTILQHCIFGGALACATSAGGDASTLKRHLDAQSQVLHRIALHEKLGKKEPIAEYAGELLAELEALKPASIDPSFALATAGLALSTELSEPTLNVIRRISEERERWDFVKARQLTLALQAQSANVPHEGERAAIENALRAYAQASMTVLQKLFVRIRIDRTTGLLFQSEPALDAAARAVLTTFSAALPR